MSIPPYFLQIRSIAVGSLTLQSYVFVDNPDTVLSDEQPVIFAKSLGYAFLATIPSRCFLVSGRDYFGYDVWDGADKLRPYIDPLLHVNRTFAFGKTNAEYLDDKVIALSRDDDGGSVGQSARLLTVLNLDAYNKRKIICHTPFGSNMYLHAYAGHHDDIWTDAAVIFASPKPEKTAHT